MLVYVTKLRRLGGNLPHTVPPLYWPPLHQGLSLGNYHIRNDQGSGIEQAIRADCVGGFDLIIIAEENITDRVYCLNSVVYDIVCLKVITTADGNAQG